MGWNRILKIVRILIELVRDFTFRQFRTNISIASKNLRFFDASNPFFVHLEKEFRKKSQGKNERFIEKHPKMGFSADFFSRIFRMVWDGIFA